MKQFLILITILLTYQVGISQNFIFKEQMAQDIDNAVEWMERIHPHPYRFESKESILGYSKRLKESLPDSVERMSFWRSIDKLIVFYNDAHTRTFPYPLFHQYHHNEGLFFPFHIEVNNGKLFVTEKFCEHDIQVGSQINSINTIKAGDIIDRMKLHSNKELSKLKESELSDNFPFFIWRAFGWDSLYTIEVEGKQDFINLEGVKYEKIYSNFWNENENWFDTQQIDRQTAYIKIINFNSSRKEAKKRYREIFKQITRNGTENLIIDFRNHDGGDDRQGDDLAKYISNKPYKRLEKTLWKITPEYISAFEQRFIPKSVRWMKPLYLINEYSSPLVKGSKSELYEVKYKEKKPFREKKRFKGNVFLLINNNTFSAGSVFATMFRDYDMGKIIGQSSGNLSSFSAFALVEHHLPNSKFKFRISSAYSVRINGDEGLNSLEPDISLDRHTDALDYTVKKIINLTNAKTP